jgi:glucan phosphoethanolaminetransferase (alkaline phosphatase superfamily)
VIVFPFQTGRTRYLLFAFAAGILMDVSLGTGGVFAAASTTFALLRNVAVALIKPEWMERNREIRHLTMAETTLYVFAASLALTALVYIFDSAGIKVLFQDFTVILQHGLFNFFFYFIFIVLIYWNNIYQTRNPQ